MEDDDFDNPLRPVDYNDPLDRPLSVDADYKAKEALSFAHRHPLPAPDDHYGWRALEQAELALGPHPVLAKRFRPETKVARYWVPVAGGWSHGYAEMDGEGADFLASELRAVIFNVEYRLIPEYQWPQNHNDCYQAIDWVMDHAREYDVDPERVGLWGQSAGAHLAAGAALRDAMEHNPGRIRHMNLTVPVVCDPRKPPFPLSQQRETNLPQMPQALVAQFQKVLTDLTGSDKPCDDPYFSPLLQEIPAHHCPVHISVAGLDMLRDGGIAYAIQLRKFGIDAQLHVLPGVPHAFSAVNETRGEAVLEGSGKVVEYGTKLRLEVAEN
ncbi:alpha/beta-hydrolase [Dacryopinax primogenitus]|uniref:Alpha/beta-hydrolase n=1 Tax=Dacryopinax primogenitus (strain DJM 731) TaxID=1858805 RepID=M5FZ17_DACPD|nr:alpha/beta-hydrolase [Dacryopinax primogenitus]EJU01749.1 alpha/beta-hydrolase [Dacryopinax primogenitus]